MRNPEATRVFRARLCLWICRGIILVFWLLWPWFPATLNHLERYYLQSVREHIAPAVATLLEADFVIAILAMPLGYAAVVLLLLPALIYDGKPGFRKRLRYTLLAVLTAGLLPCYWYFRHIDPQLRRIAATRIPP